MAPGLNPFAEVFIPTIIDHATGRRFCVEPPISLEPMQASRYYDDLTDPLAIVQGCENSRHLSYPIMSVIENWVLRHGINNLPGSGRTEALFIISGDLNLLHDKPKASAMRAQIDLSCLTWCTKWALYHLVRIYCPEIDLRFCLPPGKTVHHRSIDSDDVSSQESEEDLPAPNVAIAEQATETSPWSEWTVADYEAMFRAEHGATPKNDASDRPSSGDPQHCLGLTNDSSADGRLNGSDTVPGFDQTPYSSVSDGFDDDDREELIRGSKSRTSPEIIDAGSAGLDGEDVSDSEQEEYLSRTKSRLRTRKSPEKASATPVATNLDGSEPETRAPSPASSIEHLPARKRTASTLARTNLKRKRTCHSPDDDDDDEDEDHDDEESESSGEFDNASLDFQPRKRTHPRKIARHQSRRSRLQITQKSSQGPTVKTTSKHPMPPNHVTEANSSKAKTKGKGRPTAWTPVETEALGQAVLAQRAEEEELGLKPLQDMHLFKKVSSMLAKQGIMRTTCACKYQWSRFTRFEFFLDERTRARTSSLVTSSQARRQRR